MNGRKQRPVADLDDKMRSRGLSSIRLKSPELGFLIFIEQKKNEGG